MAAPMEQLFCGSNVGVNWENIRSLGDVKAELNRLSSLEDEINTELSSCFQQQTCLGSKLSSLYKVMPNLAVIHNDTKQLTGMISFTSQLAENVSGKVRQLDIAKSRVLAASLRVEDILDLKFCTDGVQNAMQEENYEQAAALIHRFLSMDESILKLSATAAEGSSLSASFAVLHEAERKLKTIAHSKFDAAARSGDVASVERFFKIFPLLGIHEEGLTKFGKYLSAQVSEKANKALAASAQMNSSEKRAAVLFADLLESLFEHLAKLIEIHQPMVETKYSHGWLLVFVKWLQKECDRQTRAIMEQFLSQRQLKATVQKVQECIHSRSGTEKFDPKSLDPVLGEMTLMNSKSELYLRFLRRRMMADLEHLPQDDDRKQAKLEEVEDLIKRCELSMQMQELVGYYIMLEQFYMMEMARKAASMDTHSLASSTSSVVDDTFYLVKKSLRRALASASVDGVCAVINHASTLLEDDYVEMLRSKLKAGYPSGHALSQAYTIVQSSIQQGKLQASDVDKARLQFLIALNNAEASSENITLLKTSMEAELPKLLTSDNKNTQEKLESCLTDLGNISKRFKDALDFGMEQLKQSAIKSRIKLMIDSLLSTNHNITDETFALYEAEDPWVQACIVDLDSFVQQFKPALTPTNYEAFVSLCTSEIAFQLEKSVPKITFNRLGGLQFDKELRSLLGYLTSVTTWTVRDKFAKLTQMTTILNLDKVSEIMDYWGANSGPFTWRLTPSEVRQVLALRVDFSNDEIKKLKL